MLHVPPPHLACRRPDVADELPDHDYDYISVGNSETLTENPQPSTAGNDASEVQFELTPYEAYEPGNPQPSTAGEDASKVQFELTPCEAYGPVTLSPHARL